MFKHNQIVADHFGNHFRVFDVVGDVVKVESVATKQLFTAPVSDLFATNREAF